MSAPKWGGAPSEKCMKCGKTVYVAEMAKMENQIWHIECLRCVECNKKLAGSNWGGFVPPDNKPYCNNHHKKLLQAAGSAVEFSGSTANSKWAEKQAAAKEAGESGQAAPAETKSESSDSGAPKFGGAPDSKCQKCGKTVYPAEMNKMEGQIWHIDCLKCVECSKKISGANWGGFVPPDNKPYCNVHHKRLLQAAGSSAEFSGSTASTTWTPKNTEPKEPAAAGAKPRWGGAPSEKCVKCGKTVYNAEMAKMEGQIWHADCLRCVEPECNKRLAGANWGGFVPPDNKPYCNVHHKRLIAASGSAVGISGSTARSDSKWTISKD